MIAQLITFGKTSEEAISRMIRAIDDYHITGIETTLQFGKYVMQHPAFISGNFDTKFIDKHFNPEKLKPTFDHADVAALAASVLFSSGNKKPTNSNNKGIDEPTNINWVKNRKAY